MKCVDPGTIQAFIDGELDIALKKDIEKHLICCGKCFKALEELKKNDDLAFGQLTAYRQFCEENYEPADAAPAAKRPAAKRPATIRPAAKRPARKRPARKRPATGKAMERRARPSIGKTMVRKTMVRKTSPAIRKEAKGFMFRYRKIAAAVCLAATITACVVVQPVRAFISEALSIFRVESVKGFRISLAELEEIRRKLEQKDGEIDIEAVGRIKREGFREQRVSMDEARAAAGFPVLFPTDAVDELLEIRAVEPGTISFMLKIGSMNEVLGALGARTLLPQSLDGKTLTAVFAYQLDFKYNKGGNTFRVSQTISPELVVPADVDVDEMYECMAELPILPEDVQRQLKSIKDWKNTVYLPVVDAEPQEADINGAKGFIAEKRNSGCILVWYDGGAIYSVEGSAGLEETLDFARGMR